MSKVYFKNLDGLRFFAALLVIIHHADRIRLDRNVPNLYSSFHFLGTLGDRGVNLFFVLSGFLITYLLLAEQNRSSKISVKTFYLKRILRIWPLYFLMVALTFLVLPHMDFLRFPAEGNQFYPGYSDQLIYYLFFAVQFTLINHPALPYGIPLWSVSVEEQFYLVWPWFLVLFKKFNALAIIFLVFLAYKAHSIIWQICFETVQPPEWAKTAYTLLHQTRIELFAMGGLGAKMLLDHKKLLRWIYFPGVQGMIWLFFIYVFVNEPVIFPWINFKSGFLLKAWYLPNRLLIEGMANVLIIILLATHPKSWISFEHPILKWLGKISYGLYVFNWLAVVLASYLVEKFMKISHLPIWDHPYLVPYHFLFYSLCVLLTVGMAALSYRFVEARFLAIKERL